MTAASKNAKAPVDNHKRHIWIQEPAIPNGGALTDDGLAQIANHKYVGGSYTLLDTYLSPNLWQPLTDMLPLWLAPNVVTTIGGAYCLLSFVLSSLYLNGSTAEQSGTDVIPRWLFFSNGICMFFYYTFDCMDGKQARRTGSSSPLGQLFDHGMDCVCNLSHLQLVQCITLVPPRLLVILQCSLQFTFWQAQWEEYYTGILPHATGDYCGVTEVNYGMALWSISAGIIGPEIYSKSIINVQTLTEWNSSFLNWLVDEKGADLQVRHILAIGWASMIICLLSLSWMRVYKHVKDVRVFAIAMSKLTSPFLLCVVAVVATDSYHHYVPEVSFTGYVPSAWLALGLCFSLITIKIIVYSMARMAYATFQMDIIPFLVVALWIHADDDGDSFPVSPSIAFAILDLYYFGRLVYWIRRAIHQLCSHLQIQLFRIKEKKSE
jgi:ethanolaminephosphotransferase